MAAGTATPRQIVAEPAGARTVSAPVLRFVWRSLGELGADRQLLAREAGLPLWALRDDSVRLDLEPLLKLWRLGRAMRGPDVGIRVATRWSRGALHLVDYLYATAPTLGDALRLLVRYRDLAVRNSANRFAVLDHPEGLELRCQVRSGDEQVDPVATQFCLALNLQLSRRMLGRVIVPVGICLAGGSDVPRRQLAQAFGTHQIEGDTGHAAIVLARADVDSPLPTADPILAKILRGHADSVIGAQLPGRGWLDEFRDRLLADLRRSGMSLSMVARSLAMSPRTLQRRLDEAGTNWTAEIDRARREAAIRWLRQGRSREEIAAALGYSDVRSLRRTLQRWSRQELSGQLPASPNAAGGSGV